MSGTFLNIPLPQVVPEQQTSLINAMNMNTSLVGDRLKAGFGSQSISADSRGWWVGAEEPENAPFYTDMQGRVILKSADPDTYILIDTVNTRISFFKDGIEQGREGNLDD